MALTTNQSGRLMAYTWEELGQYTWEEINNLPYGINRAFAAAENAAALRGQLVEKAQADAEKVDIVAYSALEDAVGRLGAAADGLLASFD